MAITFRIFLCIFIMEVSMTGNLLRGEDRWTPSITYNEIVSKAQGGSPYYQGLLGIYLRSGEAGSKVNIELSRQWSEAAYAKQHPFGSYNLANLAMLKGDFEGATRLYQDAALLLQRQASVWRMCWRQ